MHVKNEVCKYCLWQYEEIYFFLENKIFLIIYFKVFKLWLVEIMKY